MMLIKVNIAKSLILFTLFLAYSNYIRLCLNGTHCEDGDVSVVLAEQAESAV